jgi:predicted DNA-binding transcriptional regulator YafY
VTIPRHRTVSAKAIQETLPDDLQRDLRTIQRQLEMLATHFDVQRDESFKPYSYSWKERGPSLSVPLLNEQESLVLALAREQLRFLLPPSVMKSMDGFFDQAGRRLEHGSKAREWLGKVRVVSDNQPLLPPKIRPGVFEAVSQALYNNQWLRLSYQNADRKRSEAEVMPLGLAQQGARLYLVCRYKGYENERSLAVHRILSATSLDSTFVRPPNFALEKYDAEGRFGISLGERVSLRLVITRAAGEHLLESKLSADQSHEEDGDNLIITATVVKTQRLLSWIRSFGDDILTSDFLPS